MKKSLFILGTCLLLLTTVVNGQAATGPDTKIKATFHTPAGTTAWPYVVCPATNPTSCVAGYIETVTPPTGSGGTPATITAACSGTTVTNCFLAPDSSGNIVSVFTPGGGGNLYSGTWTISVVANWLDNTGKAVASLPMTTTVVESVPFVASPVMGLSAVPQP